MHRNGKPVRKCNGCSLNFRDNCGVYTSPHDQWERKRGCPGFGNEQLLAEYEEQAQKLKVNSKKIKRKEAAKKMHSEPHHDGDRHVMMTVLQ